MRIWHQSLIPLLCRQHLLACWREGLGAYKIITENKKGYRNHPAVKEWEAQVHNLWGRLYQVRQEMLKRGYKPKEMPEYQISVPTHLNEWQNLEQQIEVLRGKKCKCNLTKYK